MPSLIDRAISAALERPYIKQKLINQSPPRYMRAEVGGNDFDFEQYFSNLDEAKQQKLALSVSWIFADLHLLSNKTTSSRLKVMRMEGEELKEIINHDYEKLLMRPNPFMSRSFLIRYLIFWLNLSRKGAFMFLAPRRGTNDLVELWPINSNRIWPIKNKANWVKWFLYQPSKDQKPIRLNAHNVLWLRYPNPFKYWESLPPLHAALDAMSIELGISDSQQKFYTKGRGMPLSIVSVSPDIAEPDYSQFRQDLKDDWEADGTTLAIARGGTLDVKALGFTQKDLEILGNQEMSRDKIDSIFFGIPFRAIQARGGGDALKQADRFINDNVIHPLHTFLAEEQTVQVLHPFYGVDLKAIYEDIRLTDRALTIQENNVNSRWATIDEMRVKEGLQPLDDSEVGELLVPLATNPSFVASLKGLTADPARVETEDEPGNLPESQDAEMMANQLTETKSDMANEAIRAELKRFKTVAKRSLNKSDNPLQREFKTTIIPVEIMADITTRLLEATSESDIVKIFEPHIENATS